MIYFDTHKTLIVITLIKGNTFLQSKFRDERFMIIIPSDLAPDYTKDYHGIYFKLHPELTLWQCQV